MHGDTMSKAQRQSNAALQNGAGRQLLLLQEQTPAAMHSRAAQLLASAATSACPHSCCSPPAAPVAAARMRVAPRPGAPAEIVALWCSLAPHLHSSLGGAASTGSLGGGQAGALQPSAACMLHSSPPNHTRQCSPTPHIVQSSNTSTAAQLSQEAACTPAVEWSVNASGGGTGRKGATSRPTSSSTPTKLCAMPAQHRSTNQEQPLRRAAAARAGRQVRQAATTAQTFRSARTAGMMWGSTTGDVSRGAGASRLREVLKTGRKGPCKVHAYARGATALSETTTRLALCRMPACTESAQVALPPAGPAA